MATSSHSSVDSFFGLSRKFQVPLFSNGIPPSFLDFFPAPACPQERVSIPIRANFSNFVKWEWIPPLFISKPM
jgi:hypothetical protein